MMGQYCMVTVIVIVILLLSLVIGHEAAQDYLDGFSARPQ